MVTPGPFGRGPGKLLDEFMISADIRGVQQVVSTYRQSACQNELFKTQVQPAQCLLNTRKPCACVGVGNLSFVPALVKSRGGSFLLGDSRQTRALPLNRETASCHTVAGTCAACLWAMLRLGHARKPKSHRPTVKENVSPLNAFRASIRRPAMAVKLPALKESGQIRRLLATSCDGQSQQVAPLRLRRVRKHQSYDKRGAHSEDCGFPFLLRPSLTRVPIRGTGGFSYLPVFVLLCLCTEVPVHLHLNAVTNRLGRILQSPRESCEQIPEMVRERTPALTGESQSSPSLHSFA